MRLGDAFRFNAKPCKAMSGTSTGACGARFSVYAKFVQTVDPRGSFIYSWESTDGKIYDYVDYSLAFRCICGRRRLAQSVIGKYNAGKKCDGRCLAATGHQCECACGGKNHGAGHETQHGA